MVDSPFLQGQAFKEVKKMSECVIAKPAPDAKSFQFVLDEFGEIKRFSSKDNGISFLQNEGFSKKEIAALDFIDDFELDS